MSSTVDICNRALQKLGAKRINSLSDDTKNGRACNFAYTPILHKELRDHTWNCAIKRATLAADVTPPDFGRANSFPLPSDFLRLLPPDPSQNLNTHDWQVEGRKIFTDDDDPIYIRYVYEITDPEEMDALLVEALSAKLAFELCEELTQSNTKKEALRADYDEAIKRARKANAIESVAQVPPEDTWVTVRQ